MNKVGERIHLIRRRRGLSLKALARTAGTSYTGLSRLERGQKPQVSFDVMVRIAAALKVSLDYLAKTEESEDGQPALGALALESREKLGITPRQASPRPPCQGTTA
jgi:transcriptional regulator with XRE-family HTH domain